MLTHSRVIAKGKRIRDLPRLLELYGGQSPKWLKKSSPIFEKDGVSYEHHGIGRFEIKLKEM